MSKANEEAVRKNLTAIRDHSLTTRELMELQGAEIQTLRNMVLTLDGQVKVLDGLLSSMHVSLYTGGVLIPDAD